MTSGGGQRPNATKWTPLPLDRAAAATPHGLEARRDDAMGCSGLFALRPFSAGEVLFSEVPTAAVSLGECDHAHCSHCLHQLPDTATSVQCSRACESRYCCQQCADEAESMYHHVLCSGVSPEWAEFCELARESQNEYYILAARLLVSYDGFDSMTHWAGHSSLSRTLSLGICFLSCTCTVTISALACLNSIVSIFHCL